MRKNVPLKIIIPALSLALFFTGCTLVSQDQTNENTNQALNQNENTNISLSQNTNQEAEIDTNDWLTYQNEEYGFEVTYPNSWNYHINVQEKCWLFYSQETENNNKKWIEENTDGSQYLVHYYDFGVCTVTKPKGATLEEWFNNLKEIPENIEYLTVGNSDGAKYLDTLSRGTYLINANSDYYFFNISRINVNQEPDEVFNKMISLFKIL